MPEILGEIKVTGSCSQKTGEQGQSPHSHFSLFTKPLFLSLGFSSAHCWLHCPLPGLCQLGLINISAALLSNVVIITQRAFSNTIIFILSYSPSDHIRGLETFNFHNNRERYLFARRDTVTPSHLDWLIISLQFPVMIQLIVAIVDWRCTY